MIYQYHSTLFGSDVQVSYNQHGLLCGFTVLTRDVEKINSQTDQFKNYYREEDFVNNAKQHKLKVVKIEREVSFEMFWDAYKQKDCGRTKAEQTWNKMSKADQVEAFEFIPAFNGILKNSGTAKPYATTYLNQKRWIR
jgi:hypothetical protein